MIRKYMYQIFIVILSVNSVMEMVIHARLRRELKWATDGWRECASGLQRKGTYAFPAKAPVEATPPDMAEPGLGINLDDFPDRQQPSIAFGFGPERIYFQHWQLDGGTRLHDEKTPVELRRALEMCIDSIIEMGRQLRECHR